MQVPPPTKNNTRNCYRGIHLVVAEGLGAAVSVTMISNLGRFVLLENEARCSFQSLAELGTEIRAGMREVHRGVPTAAAHARGGRGVRLSQ